MCVAHGHELRQGVMRVGEGCRAEGYKGEEKYETTIIA